MPAQVVRQPDGRYAVWSSVTDDFVAVNLEAADVIEATAQSAAEEVRQEMTRIIGVLEKGGKPYFQFTKTFEECVETTLANHGNGTASLRELGIDKQHHDKQTQEEQP